MSSQLSSSSTTLLHHGSISSSDINTIPVFSSYARYPSSSKVAPFSLGAVAPKDERPANFGVSLKCKALSKPRTEVIKWNGVVEDDKAEEAVEAPPPDSKKIKEQHIDAIRSMLGSMGDGEISISAYDTAWVALVEDIHGSGAPQFPSTLKWISKNQLPDGSWGDDSIFEAHDRLINTLACVIALKSWNIHPDQSEKGVAFIKANICKLEEEDPEHMPIGFEVAFPSLIELAKKLDIEIQDDAPVLQEIYAGRDLKLRRIPKDKMHMVPTTLLHSLEGMPVGLEWEKLLKLQCQDGSFLFSPSSTAFALMQTKDDNCLRYLSRAVEKFEGGVPNVYPVDLFEHIWAVDRLQRLGISRFFESEIKECINYIQRYWTEEGICWARNSAVFDIDDTAMGFRLLRLHGHQVSAGVFEHFKKGDEFFCFAGQSNQAVTGMYNLYRASQVMFPGEKILEEGKKFSSEFLKEKRASNELLDKWIITKDLPGEVGYALDVPWYASLPRVETRFFLEQYGGDDDVWIGKTLYRMPYVSNNTYLELAKLDYNNNQVLHLEEWGSIQDWFTKSNLGEFGMGQSNPLMAYFLATTSIFEAERANERLAWAKTANLVEAIASYFEKEGASIEGRREFLHEYKKRSASYQHYEHNNGRYNRIDGQGQRLISTLFETIDQLDAPVAEGRDIRHQLHQNWEMWMMAWQEDDGDMSIGEAELLVRTLLWCNRRLETVMEPSLYSHPEYKSLSEITTTVCHKLRQFQRQESSEDKCVEATVEIQSNMQELVQMVFCPSLDGSGIHPEVKQTLLTVARAYYYVAHCTPGMIDSHIAKVLFERVI